MIIVKVEAVDGFHPYEFQSGRTKCWQRGYIEVPKSLESAFEESGGFCDLIIEEDALINIIPRPDYKPAEEPMVLTREDEIEALLVEQEYRLTLLELGVRE